MFRVGRVNDGVLESLKTRDASEKSRFEMVPPRFKSRTPANPFKNRCSTRSKPALRSMSRSNCLPERDSKLRDEVTSPRFATEKTDGSPDRREMGLIDGKRCEISM
jgi:hypothetical protein